MGAISPDAEQDDVGRVVTPFEGQELRFMNRPGEKDCESLRREY